MVSFDRINGRLIRRSCFFVNLVVGGKNTIRSRVDKQKLPTTQVVHCREFDI